MTFLKHRTYALKEFSINGLIAQVAFATPIIRLIPIWWTCNYQPDRFCFQASQIPPSPLDFFHRFLTVPTLAHSGNIFRVLLDTDPSPAKTSRSEAGSA